MKAQDEEIADSILPALSGTQRDSSFNAALIQSNAYKEALWPSPI